MKLSQLSLVSVIVACCVHGSTDAQTITRVRALILLTVLVVCSQLFSAAVADHVKGTSFVQYLDNDRTESPFWASSNPESEIWFKECEKRINTAWMNEPDEALIDEPIGVTFLLKANGAIEDPFIFTAGSSKTVDKVALQVIERSAPFPTPPDYLLDGKRMLVSMGRYKRIGRRYTTLLWDAFDYHSLTSEDREEDFQRLKRLHQKKEF